MITSTTPETPEQLVLLPEPAVPLRFRLDEATRRRGLRHIAEIRALLEHRPVTQPVNEPEVREERADLPFRHPQAA